MDTGYKTIKVTVSKRKESLYLNIRIHQLKEEKEDYFVILLFLIHAVINLTHKVEAYFLYFINDKKLLSYRAPNVKYIFFGNCFMCLLYSLGKVKKYKLRTQSGLVLQGVQKKMT